MKKIEDIANHCIECKICLKECLFLQEKGTPGEICTAYLQEGKDGVDPFLCNMCGLCQAVCPCSLDMPAAVLAMREDVQKKEGGNPAHRGILAYENWGDSKLLRLEHLPQGCSTIFFPGCALAATRDRVTERAYHFLQERDPSIGIILACCHKPSHDLGKQDLFTSSLERLLSRLREEGIKKIITACPSCYRIFKEYGQGFDTISIYEELRESPPICKGNFSQTFSIHDACSTRFSVEIQNAVREILPKNMKIKESVHSKEKTICCGEGGAVSCLAPRFRESWQKREREAGGEKIITYCAGCSVSLGKNFSTVHLLDILFDEEGCATGKEQKTAFPFTYLHRFLLKKRLEKDHATASKTPWAKAALLITIISLACTLRVKGVDNFLQKEHLELLILHMQNLSPLLYISIMALVPVCFLPAFPFVMVAGLLYGHVWGIIYAMTGASLGAALSFLVSRYIAGNWLQNKMKGLFRKGQGEQLESMIEKHGWKIVFALRLIPLFPFTPLNYALGLSGIRFHHYLLATILGILPACTAFILFSNSLPALLSGEMGPLFFVGAGLMLSLSVISILGRKKLLARSK
ncbi:VTT domain-containing protein [Desulfotalea psychrophila]|nr:VTT domain-containing protein [Desulfotalea psychrophila]